MNKNAIILALLILVPLSRIAADYSIETGISYYSLDTDGFTVRDTTPKISFSKKLNKKSSLNLSYSKVSGSHSYDWFPTDAFLSVIYEGAKIDTELEIDHYSFSYRYNLLEVQPGLNLYISPQLGYSQSDESTTRNFDNYTKNGFTTIQKRKEWNAVYSLSTGLSYNLNKIWDLHCELTHSYFDTDWNYSSEREIDFIQKESIVKKLEGSTFSLAINYKF